MAEPVPNKKFFRPDEVADILCLSKRTVYRMVKNGRIPATQNKGLVRITRETIEEWTRRA